MTPWAWQVLLDVAVVVLVVAAVILGARAGWRSGASRSVLSLAGLVAGAVVGLALSAWWVSEQLSPLVHLVLVAACVVGGALVGSALGGAAGDLLGRGLARLHLGLLDRTAGAGVRAVVAVVVCSLMAGLVTAFAPPSSAVARSSVVADLADVVPQARSLSGVVPPARSVLDDVRGVLPAGAGDDLFAVVPATSSAAVAPSEAVVRRVGEGAAASVVKVVAPTCRADQLAEGTGFWVAASSEQPFVVTNAHVVGSATRVVVEGERGREDARVVVDDRDADIAVLAVSGRSGPALSLASGTAANGTPAVVLGHPLGGPLTATSAVVVQRLPEVVEADGTDVLPGSREAFRLDADVQHGNSGSPLLDTSGTVIGVVNAAGLTGQGTGYALTLGPLRTDLATAAASAGSMTTTTIGGASSGC
ncbi:Colicin V production protein [Quadrisphaera granulorum]|uniref:Colicin V production protein n=1 Tax=Quadrisphaera granulorum TaxID=317664 RepID=A0A316AAX1_9ACTN|nr:CvpA family protein [Quadrisphaera granulorum]PWJ54925.1 colicin V production protein [Quadrisphaera granulorum]SZE95871.1 Colicin V production protein [Quadrisphaera granulorum]